MTPSRLPLPVAVTSMAMLLVLSACGGDSSCDPSDPTCNTGGSVANVTVTSPIDSVMAVGSTVALDAEATDASDDPVSTSFTWTSSNASVAIVNGSGVVTAASAGTTDVEASAGGETGSIRMRAVDADLARVSSALTDPCRIALAAALTGTPASTISRWTRW